MVDGAFSEIFQLSGLNLQTFLVFFLAFLLACLYLRRPRNLPPYPAGCWPVLGHLLALGRAPHLQLTAWRRQYGDVFTVRMGMEDVVVLNGYTAVKDALVDRSELFASRPQNYIFDLINGFGKAIVSTQWGKAFKQKRKFASTILRTLGVKEGMGSIEEKIREETGFLCAKVAKYGGQPFDPESDLHFTIANVICSIVFGNRFDYGDGRFRDLSDAVLVTMDRLGAGQIINVFPFLRFVPGGKYSLHQDILLASTSAFRCVQSELDAVVGGAQPALSHRAQLPYTEATLMEVQRMRAVAPLGLPHSTTQDVTFGEFDLPAGVMVLTNLHSLHMDPAYWPDPDRFDPERFLDAEGKVISKPKSFMPFSGARVPGEQLAKMELFLLFSSLLQNFTFKSPEGAPALSVEGSMRLTLTPPSYKICAIPR
ncbi:cytochrome P450 2J1-like [Branchiostoma floridae]|uniref:Cytochrome P450 2J1-like n=1 Tax=Branchiostoma floridae TaxID=7739 RepID=A0A9J7HLE0_BRAFL|nr:cytochrome P450 2J1-like [Branchiostoma floridae]